MKNGQGLTEKLTKIGLLIAIIAAILAPMNLLTSFFGMNMKDFSADGLASLFDFWRLSIPAALITIVGFIFAGSWIWRTDIAPAL